MTADVRAENTVKPELPNGPGRSDPPGQVLDLRRCRAATLSRCGDPRHSACRADICVSVARAIRENQAKKRVKIVTIC